MTSFIPGAPDFQLQNAPSTNLIGEFAYNSITAPLVIDLSALVLPHHQGLAFEYVITGGDVSGAVQILTNFDSFQSIQVPPATLYGSQTCVRSILGAFFVQGTPSLLSLTVSRAAGINNQTGIIRVFGLTVLPLATEWNQPGKVWSLSPADVAGVGAGATAPVLATPAPGFVWKIKALTARSNGATAVNLSMAFTLTTSGIALARFATAGVANDAYFQSLDLWCDDGISFANGAAVTYRASVIAESWQLT